MKSEIATESRETASYSERKSVLLLKKLMLKLFGTEAPLSVIRCSQGVHGGLMCFDDFSSVSVFSFFLCWLKSHMTCVHFHDGECQKEEKKNNRRNLLCDENPAL